MLPTINPSTLERNPKFKLLYQDLANTRLNPDGSSRLIKQQRAQTDTDKTLQALRKESAQKLVLQRGLETVADGGSLPDQVLQACRVAVAVLRGEIGTQDRDVLATDLEAFQSNISQIIAPISSRLEQEVALVNDTALIGAGSVSSETAQAASNSGTPSKQLSSNVAILITSIASQSSSISATRARIADLMDALASANREALESGIRVLEQTVHGSVARAAKARAENATVVAQGLELKIKILARTDPVLNDPQLVSGLQSYSERLANTENELLGKVANLEKELSAYEEQGTAMKQIVSRYSELLKKKEHLDGEIQRLRDVD